MKCKDILLATMFAGVMLITFTVTANAIEADESDFYNEIVSNITDNLDEETLELLSLLGIEDYSPTELSEISFSDVISAIFGIFKNNLVQPLNFISVVTGVLILTSVAGGIISNNNTIGNYFESVTVIFIALYMFSQIIVLITDAVSVVHTVGTFMKLLIPILAAIVTLSGNPALATSSGALSVYISEVIIAVCNDFLTSVLCVFTAVAVCASVNGSINISPIINLFKRIFNTALGLLGTIYSGVLTIRDVVSAGIDRISVKGIRFVLGSAVPIVGGTLSEGLSAALSALTLFKNTFGIIGIIIAAVITFPIIIRLILWISALLISEYIASSMSREKASAVFSSMRYVITMLVSLLMFSVFVFLISVSTILIMSKN